MSMQGNLVSPRTTIVQSPVYGGSVSTMHFQPKSRRRCGIANLQAFVVQYLVIL